ncbi:MAG: MarR family winged helix-turn-helix transcriptional regulator [Clostridiales bacterium]|nr:MarR family winged helix-turn-helix transcriptional regulator [Clostridiales bacterium]
MEKKCRVGAKLHRIDLLMRWHLRAEDQSLIPPAQMRMLEFISKKCGCTQAEVAEEMGVTQASVAQSIKRMEASGLIERNARQGDMRANSLSVTEKGVLAAKNCRLVFDGLENRMFEGFTEDEKAMTGELLSRLIANLEMDGTGEMNNMELSKLLSGERKGERE